MMHDIWNPWHGCVHISEGCANCYMYTLDRWRGADGAKIYRTNNFDYPLQRTKSGEYRVKSGELIRVCMTSDFFLPEADVWRAKAWNIMYARPDVKFFLLTKRPERVRETLPPDFGDGWENIFFNVTCENQRRADERIPILLNLPFKHKGIMCAPFIGRVSHGMEERILEFAESSATVELAAHAAGCEPARIAKTLSFDLAGKPILVVTAGDRKIAGAKFKAEFHGKPKMLATDMVEERIGHAVGGVCPFAVNDGVKVYLDISLKRFDTVFPACGSGNSAIELTPEELEKYSGAVAWVDVCG